MSKQCELNGNNKDFHIIYHNRKVSSNKNLLIYVIAFFVAALGILLHFILYKYNIESKSSFSSIVFGFLIGITNFIINWLKKKQGRYKCATCNHQMKYEFKVGMDKNEKNDIKKNSPRLCKCCLYDENTI